VAPFGGKKKAIGANPIGVGIPGGQKPPFVLDISTSVVAGGKVVLHAQEGRPIPYGWILDREGKPTTDPTKLFKPGDIGTCEGSLLPMAGYKGFGLGLAAEILGGILSGYGTSNDPDYREGNGGFITAIDVEKFMPSENFGQKTDDLFRYLKKIPATGQASEVLIPGELEFQAYRERMQNGIPINDVVWSRLVELAGKMHIPVESYEPVENEKESVV
jgi:LDH2 family malate/lactate/ureidoglycolate dehydrogenase